MKNDPNGTGRVIFLLVACVLAASIGVMYWSGQMALDSADRVAGVRLAIDRLERVFTTLKEAETGQRGYLLNGQESYLEPYRTALTNANVELKALHRLAASGDLATNDVQQLLTLAQQELARLDHSIRLRREQGLVAALNVMASGEERQAMDQIGLVLGRMQLQQEAELRKALASEQSFSDLRTATFVVMGLLNLAFLAWAYRRLEGEMRHKHQAVLASERQKEFLNVTLNSIGDAVIVADPQGRISLLNPEAERLTGWKASEAAGKPLLEVFRIVNEDTRQPVEDPVDRVLRIGSVVGLANHTVLLTKNGREVPIDDSGAPVRKGDGPIQGAVLVFRDVSAQRQAQRASEQLAAIVRSSDDAIVSKDLHGTIQTWNAAAERLFGYTAAEVIGQPITVLLPPDRREEEDEIMQRLQRGETLEHYETVRVAKDQRRLEVSITVSPLCDDQGQVVGASKILRDISARKRAEDALRQAKEDWERTFDAVPDLVAIMDQQHRIVRVNRSMAERLGTTPAELLGQRCFQCVHGLDRPIDACPHALTCRDGRMHATELVEPRLGGEFLVTTTPLRDAEGSVVGSVHIARDITEQKRSELALRQSEADLNRAQEVARVGSWRLNVRANQLEWSDESYRIFGLPKQSKPSYEMFLATVHPEDRDYVDGKWQAALRGEPYHFEHRIVIGGVVKWVRQRAELEFDSTKKLLSAFGTIQDITELKQAEKVFRENEERRRSEQRIRELNEQLAQRIKDLAAANAELEAFSYSVSHDLRAPLRQVAGFAGLLEEAAAGQLDAQSAEYLPLIQKAIQRMGHLIDDLLGFSRMGRAELRWSDVDLRELVEQARHTLEPAARGRLVEWKIGPLPKVRGDAAMLRQVWMNLLENALKFTRPRSPAIIEIGCSSAPAELTFYVRDNGVGFDPRYSDKLFGVFQRLHRAGEFEGTGIGLASVRRIIQRHGGRTWAESAPGQGTTLFFSLPVT